MNEQEYQSWLAGHNGDLQELRRKLAKEAGIDEVPNVIWKKLVQRRFAYYAVVGDKDSFNEAIDETTHLLEVWRGRSSGGGRTREEFYWYLNEHERERAEVKAQILAKRASADGRVQAFRDHFLGGEPLTPGQAQAFVTSLANQNVPAQWFIKHGVSFTDHATAIQAIEYRDRYEIIEFAIRPTGIEYRVEKDALSEEYGGGRMLSVGGDPPDVIRNRRNHTSLPTPEHINIAQDGSPDLGYWRGFTGYVRTDSPLGALQDLGEYLTECYRGWRSNYATRFVLTGEPPEVCPLWIEKGPGGEIVMHVAPWISSESVKNAYAHELWFRGWISEHYDGGKAKRQRRMSNKNLKLLRFVTDRIDHCGQRPRGKDVVAAWDSEYPEWAYRGDTRTMWRDYNRALRQVAPESALKGRH